MSVVKKRYLAPVSMAAKSAIRRGFGMAVVKLVFELLPDAERLQAADCAARFAVTGEWLEAPGGDVSRVRYRGYSFYRRGRYWMASKMLSGRRYRVYVGLKLDKGSMMSAIAKIGEKSANS